MEQQSRTSEIPYKLLKRTWIGVLQVTAQELRVQRRHVHFKYLDRYKFADEGSVYSCDGVNNMQMRELELQYIAQQACPRVLTLQHDPVRFVSDGLRVHYEQLQQAMRPPNMIIL